MKRDIFPVFLSGYPCRNHCIYCHASLASGITEPLEFEEFKRDLTRWLHRESRGIPREIAIYGNDSASISGTVMQPILDQCTDLRNQGNIQDIRISIRPDTVANLPDDGLVSFTIVEIGVPSMDSDVLRVIRRGHDPECVGRAIRKLKRLRIQTGCQTMLGLPGASRASDLETARKIATLGPDFVRIHPTLVLRQTPLAQMFETGEYTPAALEEAIDLTADVWDIYEAAGIPVVRCGFHLPESQRVTALLEGPWHPAFGQRVRSRRWRRRLIRRMCEDPLMAVVEVPPGNLSDAIGQHGENIHWLEKRFGRHIRIRERS